MSVATPDPAMNDAERRAHPVHAASRRHMALPFIIGIAVLTLVFAAVAASVTGFGARQDGNPGTSAMTNSGGTVGQGTNADTSGAGASASGNTNTGGATGTGGGAGGGQSSLGGGANSSGGNTSGTMGGTGGATGGAAGGATGGGR